MLKNGLFCGIPEDSYDDALKYLRASRHSFMRGEIIQHIGSEFRCAGLVLEGVIECSYIDSDFNKYNMNHIAAGSLFGESVCCAEVDESPMQISAVTDCVIMFLDFRVLYDPDLKYEHRMTIAVNLIRIISNKVNHLVCTLHTMVPAGTVPLTIIVRILLLRLSRQMKYIHL